MDITFPRFVSNNFCMSLSKTLLPPAVGTALFMLLMWFLWWPEPSDSWSNAPFYAIYFLSLLVIVALWNNRSYFSGVLVALVILPVAIIALLSVLYPVGIAIFTHALGGR